MSEEYCVVCGDIIPEGRQVCPICENIYYDGKLNIGRLARRWRCQNGIRMSRIAADTKMSFSSIWKFENANMMSYKILTWYVVHGFDLTYEMTTKKEFRKQ